MSDSALQLTLREMQTLFRSPRTLGGLLVSIGVLSISGPFQTFESLTLGPRFLYWATVAILSFAVGSFFGTLCAHITGGWEIKGSLLYPLRIAMIGVAAGLPVTFVVIVVGTVAFGVDYVDMPGIASLFGYCISISIGVAAMFALFAVTRPSTDADEKPRLLERLPIQLRGGALISLSVEDHYVEVTTTQGSTLVLMRLSDAIAETAPIKGQQIHRSHWVAHNQIKTSFRDNGRILIETSANVRLPVSRTYLSAARDAGLIT